MELSDYLRTHEGVINGGKPHERLLRDIIGNPKVIGVESFDNIYHEVKLQKEMITIGCTDLIVESGPRIVLVEAKVFQKDNPKVRDINKQLKRGYNFFVENFRMTPRLIGAYRIGQLEQIAFYELPINK